MWMHVESQLSKSQTAIFSYDLDLAREICHRENRVNAYELKIDLDCENILALYSPVAIDLRFVLAVLKINSNLERIGDIAEGIAKYVLASEQRFHGKILENAQLEEMFEVAHGMMSYTKISFQNEDTNLARSVFKMDDTLDAINRTGNINIAKSIQEFPEAVDESLYALSIIRRMERVGDQLKNIAEEIIFFVEAKVLKHAKGISPNGDV